MKISYATHADVLYVVLEDTTNKCVYLEVESGAILRLDETTDRVVGMTIPDFLRVAQSGGQFSIPELATGISANKLLEFHREKR